MSYQEEQLSKIANSIRVMQGGTTDTFSATDFANQIRNIDRDSLPYKSTIALEDNAVVVQDSLDDELDELVVYGASEQTVTEQGKNLFDPTHYVNNTYFNYASTELLSSTGAACVYCEVEIGKTYTYSQSVISSRYYVAQCDEIPQLGIAIYTTLGSTYTVTATHPYLIFSVYAPTDTETLDDVLNSIQLELGSEVTDYTPYIPDSPSPDYPAEISSVGGEIGMYGKNLFDYNNTDFLPSSSPVFSGSKEDISTYVLTPTSENSGSTAPYLGLTFNMTMQSSGTISVRGEVLRTLGIDGAARIRVTKNGSTFTVSATPSRTNIWVDAVFQSHLNVQAGDVIGLGLYAGEASANTSMCVCKFRNIQIELGDTVTDYTLYVEPTTITIPTLYGIGDVKDVMYVDRAQERAWVERNCGAKTYQGDVDEYWGAYNSVGDGVFGVYIIEPLMSTNSRKNGFSNLFIPQYTPAYRTNEGITFGASNQSLYVIISQNTVNSVDAWREFLSEQNMHVVFPLETPTIEELDYTALPTFFGGTTIMITPSDDSPTPVVAEVTLRTITDHTNEDIVSMTLTSMGVTPSGDTDTDLASLDTLGVDPYSVTSYDTSETYANEVQALGVQPTNNATDNIEILNELGVSVYE